MDFVVESGWVPDIVIRIAVRIILLFYTFNHTPQKMNEIKREFIAESKIRTQRDSNDSNEPYQLPTTFFETFLGPMLKYSACYFEDGDSLEVAEENALRLYCERAGLKDGMTVLDIGCGWGSLALYIALNYPNCKITALSPSSKQLAYIRTKAQLQSIGSITTVQADVQTFEPEYPFDRIFAIEIVEYLENYEHLFSRISKWLIPQTGQLFIHAFCHCNVPMKLSAPKSDNWVSSFFGRGGTLPSQDYFLYFQRDLEYVDHWVLPGTHYAKTFDFWLQRMDCHQQQIINSLAEVYESKQESYIWSRRWRFFTILLGEVFRSPQFLIIHYVFKSK